MIKVITNSLGSGDWITVADEMGDIWGGLSIGATDLVEILRTILKGPGVEVELVEVDDTQLEEGAY